MTLLGTLPPFDWSVINTALILGAIGYLYRQARIVDQVKQAILGMDNRGGLIEEVRSLRERAHTLANTLTSLNGTVQLLSQDLQEFKQRQPGEERRHQGRS